MEHTPKYLVMVTSQNNNKYYKMTPKGDRFEVEYGRVGGGKQTASYSISCFEKKYREKIAKGYVDRTDLVKELIVKETPETSSGYIDIEDAAIAEIVNRLQTMARKAVAENYTISSSKVTMSMVNEAQNVLASLLDCDEVELFNKTLLDLYGIIPRKMGNVSSYMAHKKTDFGQIIEREQDLLDVMKGQVYVPPKIEVRETDLKKKETILEAKEEVLRLKTELDRECRDRRAEVQRSERRILQREDCRIWSCIKTYQCGDYGKNVRLWHLFCNESQKVPWIYVSFWFILG